MFMNNFKLILVDFISLYNVTISMITIFFISPISFALKSICQFINAVYMFVNILNVKCIYMFIQILNVNSCTQLFCSVERYG